MPIQKVEERIMTTNVAASTYTINTLRLAYNAIIAGEADKAIAEVLNEQAQMGYFLDRIVTNQSPHEAHNYVWFMIIIQRAPMSGQRV